MTEQNPASGEVLLDPRVILATAVHAQPGVYALLLGSGVSTGAQVPTGWGVVKALVAQVATASGESVDDDFDPEAWWSEHGDGQSLGYSSLLSTLATTPSARRALLASFFEPTEEEREASVKIPGPAQDAIAELVRRGSVRVIMTTNFDRLVEQALEAAGTLPQVISSPDAVDGMEPLAHARCTVIKLHGDYARIDQLNTLEELSAYNDKMASLLDRVLDEYGLIVSGWSGDWDAALVASLERIRSRRYPLVWASHSSLGETARRLVAQHRALVVDNTSADYFFPDLLRRLEALDTMVESPLSRAMAIARLKRVLANPTKHIEVHDLLANEVNKVRTYIRERPEMPPANDGQTWEVAHDEIREHCDTLLHLLATGVYHDRDRQHTELWTSVIQQLMRARTTPKGRFNEYWVKLNHYPALLALLTVSVAAVSTGRDDLLLQSHRKPTWRDPFGARQVQPAMSSLHTYRVLDGDIINRFPRWDSKWLYPPSHLLKNTLKSVFVPLLGDEDTYTETFHRTEYRIALAQHIYDDEGFYNPAPGEFLTDGNWTGDGLRWESEFRQSGDRQAWGWDLVTDNADDPFLEKLNELSEILKRLRRWG